jgi:pimeloyl-[acyl-carrier protein] methyl ester esterase
MMKLSATTIGAGPDLVLLHGWGMNRAVWGGLPERLAQHYRVTLPELPGHGGSEYDAACPSLDHWVEACLDAAPERAAWIGWSLGGQIALRAALREPERVPALAVVAGTPCFVQGEGWPHAMAEETLRQFAADLAADHRHTLERFLALQVRGDREARATLRTLRHDLFERPDPVPAALRAGLDLLQGVDLRSQLPALTCPVLWLLGARDTLVPASVAGEVAQLLPQARIEVVPQAAHAPFLSHPERCFGTLREFLETNLG